MDKLGNSNEHWRTVPNHALACGRKRDLGVLQHCSAAVVRCEITRASGMCFHSGLGVHRIRQPNNTMGARASALS